MTQPEPIANQNKPIVDLIVEDIKEISSPLQEATEDYAWERKQQGIEKYGVPLQADNGRDPLLDVRDEIFDTLAYSRQLIEQNQPKYKLIYRLALEMLFYIQEQIYTRK